jgi:hypothetical protein
MIQISRPEHVEITHEAPANGTSYFTCMWGPNVAWKRKAQVQQTKSTNADEHKIKSAEYFPSSMPSWSPWYYEIKHDLQRQPGR